MQFGEFLKKEREKKGISKYSLAKSTGISITMISNYESLQNDPSVALADKMCKALGVTFSLGN